MTTYGTPEGLATFMGEGAPRDNAQLLLRKASSLVQRRTRAAVYRTDENGFPTRESYLTALTDATYTQAEAWALAGITPGTTLADAASSRKVASKSLGGASVTYESNAAATESWNRLASGEYLLSDADDILLAAGLVTSAVQSLKAGADVYVMAWPWDRFTGRYIGPGDSGV